MSERTTFAVMECGHPDTDLIFGDEGFYCAGCVVDSGNYTTPGYVRSRGDTEALVDELMGELERLGELVDRLAARM